MTCETLFKLAMKLLHASGTLDQTKTKKLLQTSQVKSVKLLSQPPEMCVQSIGYLTVWGNHKPHHLPTGSSKEETQ